MIIKIAITGNTSSGKTYISKILSEKLNCLVFDADKIVSEIYKDKNFCELYFKNHKDFSKFLNKSGTICKKKIKKEILENHFVLDKICEIIYPELKKRIFDIFEQFKNNKYIIFEIPMLFESEFDKFFNFIININSCSNLQLKRSIDKKIPEKLHKIFINKQLENNLRNQKADFVIKNDENLLKQIDECIKKLKFL